MRPVEEKASVEAMAPTAGLLAEETAALECRPVACLQADHEIHRGNDYKQSLMTLLQ